MTDRPFDKNGNIDWEYVSHCLKLPEEFMRRHKDDIRWGWISHDQKLSENFMREFADKLEWIHICTDQVLSEKFIEEMKDYIDWRTTVCSQKLSSEFIEKYADIFNEKRLWDGIFKHQMDRMTDEQIYRYQNKIGFSTYCVCDDRIEKVNSIYSKIGRYKNIL